MNNEFQNPNEDPGLQKRLILVFIVTFAIILATQPLLKKYAPQPEPEKQQQQQQQQAPAAQPPAATPPAANAPSKPASGKEQPATPQALPTKQAAGESQLVIQNGKYEITLTNRGAQATRWVLFGYKDELGKDLDLVNQYAAPKYGYPLSLWSYDDALRTKLNSGLYVADKSGTIKAPATVTFEYSDGDVSVKKSFSFDDTYVVKIKTEVIRNGQYVSAYPAWPAGFGDQVSPVGYAGGRIDYLHPRPPGFLSFAESADVVERTPAKKVSGGATIPAPFQWAGPVDQYFGALFLPDDPQNAALVMLHNQVDVPQDHEKPDPNKTMKVSVLGVAVGDPRGPNSLRLFVGPKATNALTSVRSADGSNLESSVDFGFFGVIAKPLFLWLKWTHDHWIPSWGWAIIFLTLVINGVLFPLRLSSMKSALKMQKVQPQIKAIQEKYKKYKMTDPRRADQNKELQELYAREKVNPVGGCFPMLIQMPFLFAFYSMLASAIELRLAPWLWVHDLSSADPTHLLPVGIIISMFLTQRLSPQAGMDPMQQKMMSVMMPVMMGVISWNLSAGLGLYWVASNLIGFAQQMWINNTEFGREIRARAEERARKKGK